MKTATDPLARYIDPTPHPTTMAELVSLPPVWRERGTRIQGAETTTWMLTNVALLEWKLEKDQDFHLILSDGRRTMIAEVPHPACLGGESVVADGIASARQTFEEHLRNGRAAYGQTVTIAGVGFFDREHNQTGAAFNGLELHPVTAICFGKDCNLETAARPMSQVERERELRDRERMAAVDGDVNALCRSRNTAYRTIDQYQQFLGSCRGVLGSRSTGCTEENAKSADAQVRDAIIQANDDENAFLRKWGSERFVEITCQ